MKTFNTKLTVALFTTLVLTGCMPDSLTKFKKEEPTKAPAVTAPSIVDSNGNAVDPSTLVYPSKFYFISEGATPSIERPIGTALEVEPTTDGTLADPVRRSILFISCNLVTDTTEGTTTTTPPAGLTFSTSTCKFTGTPNAVTANSDGSPVQYTVEMAYKGPDYASDGIPLKLRASIKIGIYDGPADLSYSTRQLIKVTTNSPFLEGETLLQSIVPPVATSVTAKILRRVGSDMLSIETNNGNFPQLASLDSGNVFASVKSYVEMGSALGNYNLAITLTDASQFSVGGYISGSTGHCLNPIYLTQANCTLGNRSTWYSAKALITNKVGNTIYVNFLTPSIASSNPQVTPAIYTFSQGQNVDNAYPFVATQTQITQIEASNMVFTLADASNFTAGHDITSNSFHSGYIYERSGTTIKVDEINRTGALGVEAVNSNYLRVGDTLSNSELYSSGTATQEAIVTATHDNIIVIERGVPRTIYANVSKGTSLTYSISPTLPAGLALDAVTGNISGTATFMSPKTRYVVTATNNLGSAYYAFDMEVRDYFTFADTSGTKSFLTHKVGDYKTNRACRINANDIKNYDPTDPLTHAGLDIGCNIEAEEMDLYYTSLKMSAMLGPGICEYVSFTPYAFWKYQPIKTKRTINVLNDCVNAGNTLNALSELPKPEDYCEGDYTDPNEPGAPNCDTGEITAVVWTSTGGSGGACDIPTPQAIKCGGKKAACLAGPVTSVITSLEDLENGINGQWVESYSAGLKKEWTMNSPFQSLDATNLRNANGIANNACTDSRADASAWDDLTHSTYPSRSPFAGTGPFTGPSAPNAFYEFNCLDAAYDSKARIRVTVRDWDRSFKINNRITEVVPGLAVPVLAASSRLMNSTTTTPLGVPWNNRDDWDDIYYVNNNSSSVLATSCGALPAADPGTCTNRTGGVIATRAACEAANETWLPTTYGTCSAGGHTTKSACEGAGQTWTLREFPFPEENL